MSDKLLVPLDQAHAILSSFEIDPNNRSYLRYRRDDGFRLNELEDVVAESELVLSMDWRGWLKDAIEEIIKHFAKMEVPLNADLDDDGNEGWLENANRRIHVKYVPVDDDDFDSVISSVNELFGGKAFYRKLRSCIGSDGWSYGLLPRADWQHLNAVAGDTIDAMFVVPRTPPG